MPRLLRTLVPRFRLRTLLACLTVFCTLLGVRSWRIAKERRATDRLQVAAQDTDALVAGVHVWHEYIYRRDVLKWARRWQPRYRGWQPSDAIAQLLYYHVAGVELRGDGIADSSLADLYELPHLSSLAIREAPRITDACIPTLASMERLKYLWLSETLITKEGAAELERALPDCQIRWEPRRPKPAITDVVNGHSRPRTNRGLRWITMRGPTVDDATLATLSNPHTIEGLTITEAPHVTDAGLEHLARASNLKQLTLHATTITAEGVSQLQQALPDCKIMRRPPRPARERRPKPPLMWRILNAFDPASDW